MLVSAGNNVSQPGRRGAYQFRDPPLARSGQVDVVVLFVVHCPATEILEAEQHDIALLILSLCASPAPKISPVANILQDA